MPLLRDPLPRRLSLKPHHSADSPLSATIVRTHHRSPVSPPGQFLMSFDTAAKAPFARSANTGAGGATFAGGRKHHDKGRIPGRSRDFRSRRMDTLARTRYICGPLGAATAANGLLGVHGLGHMPRTRP